MKILIAVVVLLAIIVLYLTVFQAQYNNFVNQKRVEGIDLFVSQILIPQLQQNGYVQIPIGNQTLYLVPVRPGNQTQTGGNSAPKASQQPPQGESNSNTPGGQ